MNNMNTEPDFNIEMSDAGQLSEEQKAQRIAPPVKVTIRKLTDSDWMPFGKYGPKKGDPRVMCDVPASYFHFLWNNGNMRGETSPVANYIRESLEALKDEDSDLIWYEDLLKKPEP